MFDEDLEEDPAEVKLPTFVTDHPDKPGESYYVTRAVEIMDLPLEYRKTTVRLGSGGGRVAGAPLCNVRRGDDIDTRVSTTSMCRRWTTTRRRRLRRSIRGHR